MGLLDSIRLSSVERGRPKVTPPVIQVGDLVSFYQLKPVFGVVVSPETYAKTNQTPVPRQVYKGKRVCIEVYSMGMRPYDVMDVKHLNKITTLSQAQSVLDLADRLEYPQKQTSLYELLKKHSIRLQGNSTVEMYH